MTHFIAFSLHTNIFKNWPNQGHYQTSKLGYPYPPSAIFASSPKRSLGVHKRRRHTKHPVQQMYMYLYIHPFAYRNHVWCVCVCVCHWMIKQQKRTLFSCKLIVYCDYANWPNGYFVLEISELFRRRSRGDCHVGTHHIQCWCIRTAKLKTIPC